VFKYFIMKIQSVGWT